MAPDFRQFRAWLVVVGAWALPAVATITRAYFGTRDERIVPTLVQVITLEAPAWILWMLVTPVVFYLAQRFPLERTRSARALVAHGGLALTILLATSALVIGTIRSFMGPQEAAGLDLLGGVVQVAGQKALPVIATYSALAAAAYAILLNERLQAQRLQQAQLRADLSRAELSALKMQLRPHFLFNALQSVSTLVDNDPEAAKEAVARLGDLLRTTLRNGGREMVRVDEELGFAERYLEIERTRFGDRLTIDVRVAADAVERTVPGFLLQPLVENALHHGVGARIEKGRVEIEVATVDSDLQIRIQDNGPGFRDGFREGFGLSITRKRLASLYGDKARLFLSNAAQGGAVATVHLPLAASRASI